MMKIDPQRVYRYLETTRGRVLDAARGLEQGAWSKELAIGPGSLARTLTHAMISEWYYTQRMLGREVPAYAEWPVRDETPLDFAELERAWAAQAISTRAAIAAVTDWDAPLEYAVTEDDGTRVVVRASPAEQFTQLVLHEVHHRAQALNMLRQLGAAPLGDLDFNAVMIERRRE